MVVTVCGITKLHGKKDKAPELFTWELVGPGGSGPEAIVLGKDVLVEIADVVIDNEVSSGAPRECGDKFKAFVEVTVADVAAVAAEIVEGSTVEVVVKLIVEDVVTDEVVDVVEVVGVNEIETNVELGAGVVDVEGAVEGEVVEEPVAAREVEDTGNEATDETWTELDNVVEVIVQEVVVVAAEALDVD